MIFPPILWGEQEGGILRKNPVKENKNIIINNSGFFCESIHRKIIIIIINARAFCESSHRNKNIIINNSRFFCESIHRKMNIIINNSGLFL